MEVILKQNIDNLGQKDDIVVVKSGYAMNYLIPQGLVEQATPFNRKLWEENSRQQEHKRVKQLDEAKEIAAALGNIELTVRTRASEKGRIYGSVTITQVISALQSQGHAIQSKHISFDESIKALGTYQIRVRLHKDVEQVVTLHVAEEK